MRQHAHRVIPHAADLWDRHERNRAKCKAAFEHKIRRMKEVVPCRLFITKDGREIPVGPKFEMSRSEFGMRNKALANQFILDMDTDEAHAQMSQWHEVDEDGNMRRAEKLYNNGRRK